jgi:putative transcriptional regulator
MNIIRTRRQTDGSYVEELANGTIRPSIDRTDWARLDAMSDAEITAAALGDPDAQRLTPETAGRMQRVPQVGVIRRALKLSQEAFAARFHIPIGTLRDWEQGRKDPDAAARAYLRVIGRNPEAVMEASRPTA